MKPKNISQLFALLSCLSILYSCQQEKAASEQQKIEEQEVVKSNEIVMETFQMIVDSNQVSGSILIYDSKNDTYYSNDFERAATEFLPASTFKVTNSIIGLETGVLKDRNHLFKWDGEPRRLKNWEADLTLAEAYKASCVPCYQEVARTIGTERMNEYLKKLDYGNMEIADSMIDIFWLEGEFKISQKQQIDFLKRFYNKELPISDR
ncbi:MAG: beta-lactamase class D, partial [Saprospiraceae bacterium]